MNSTIRNILAVVCGVVAGSLVNMGIIMMGGSLVPPPAGADMTTVEGLRASMHLLQPQHFLMPFLAHAIGTFAGAFLAALIAVAHKVKIALVVGTFFLIGGIAAVTMIPAPMWFSMLDLLVAYIPMAYIAGKLAARGRAPKPAFS